MEEDEKIMEFEKAKRALKIKYIIITIIVAIIVSVISSEFTLIYYSGTKLKKSEYSQNSEDNIKIISNNLKNFRKVIDELYIGEIDEEKIMEETIKGYINGLDDEYSEYMTAKEWENFQADALGNYVGIGVYMGLDKNNNVVVISPIEGTPAEEAGLKAGDIFVSVDDESVVGLKSDEVSSKIKGKEGTKVKIRVLRENDYLDFEVERKAIKVYHVKNKMLENNIGYIELLTFDDGCAEELKNAYKTLESQGAKKIILDLRNNTGGLVEEALAIADFMLPKDKKILITVDSKAKKEISYSKNEPIINCDMVVLVNEYSASASEILVGALKDNEIAKIVGKKTYGKGVIQNVMELSDKSALKLTVNEYLTPNESHINKVGIEPDYDIELEENTEDDEQLNKAIELLK